MQNQGLFENLNNIPSEFRSGLPQELVVVGEELFKQDLCVVKTQKILSMIDQVDLQELFDKLEDSKKEFLGSETFVKNQTYPLLQINKRLIEVYARQNEVEDS